MTGKVEWADWLRGRAWQYELVVAIATCAATIAVIVVLAHALGRLIGVDPAPLEMALQLLRVGGLGLLTVGIFHVLWILIVALVRWLENGRRLTAEVWAGPAALGVLGLCVLYASV